VGQIPADYVQGQGTIVNQDFKVIGAND